MSSKFVNVSINFSEEKKFGVKSFVCSIRRHGAPENYNISKAEVKGIIFKEFKKETSESEFTFESTEITKQQFNFASKKFTIAENFEELNKEKMPAMAQQA